MNEVVVKGVKIVVNSCVNRTVVDGLANMTSNYSDSKFTKVIKFIGREGLGVVVTYATHKVIDEKIDEAADAIADIIIKLKEKK